ncbi:MAG: adenylyl-sulfate kinase [Bacillota bacterium]
MADSKIKDSVRESRQNIHVVVAGHVDHGKSTIVGRLLADTGSLPEGKLEQVREKCRRNSKPFEYAFLLDALKDEQAQGVTIDSARCFFKTQDRNYILIDAPGHTEFIKNMVSGASRAEAALIVIDADDGVQANSKRHGLYLALLGISQICVLVNKMDCAGYSEERFNTVVREYREFLRQTNIESVSFVPVSGFHGDNIVRRSPNMNWYTGKTALETMEAFRNSEQPLDKPFRMPVQDVYKFTADGDQRRIVAGTVESGSLSVGDEVVFYPSGKRSRVKSVEGFNVAATDKITSGYAAGFTLTEQIYVKRGELAAKVGELPPQTGGRIKCTLVWLGKQPVVAGNKYLLKMGSAKTVATVEKITSILDTETISYLAGDQIARHEIGECILVLDKDLAFDTSTLFAVAGRFVIIDHYNISGGGIISELLERSEPAGTGRHLEAGKTSVAGRSNAMRQKGIVLWFTGLSGAGKSTIAIELERQLLAGGRFSYRLDGDNIRGGLNSDLGYSLPDRKENIRRISEVARLFMDSCMITLVSFISPLRSMREQARNIVGEKDFVEIYVKASLETCAARDAKGLYAKAVAGEIKNFTGVSSPYEEPDCPDLVLDTERNSVDECVKQVLNYLDSRQALANNE